MFKTCFEMRDKVKPKTSEDEFFSSYFSNCRFEHNKEEFNPNYKYLWYETHLLVLIIILFDHRVEYVEYIRSINDADLKAI